jgi:hypothetical protein
MTLSRGSSIAATLIADDADLDHILDAMAFKIQHPNIKINHAILIGGDEGVG